MVLKFGTSCSFSRDSLFSFRFISSICSPINTEHKLHLFLLSNKSLGGFSSFFSYYFLFSKSTGITFLKWGKKREINGSVKLHKKCKPFLILRARLLESDKLGFTSELCHLLVSKFWAHNLEHQFLHLDKKIKEVISIVQVKCNCLAQNWCSIPSRHH